ncbi:MAG: hypothetical protein P1P84_23750 [Deferrisomatales bacterium]|nr:hypothetical protein [Deferrisomatales bacterium]
MRKSLVLLAIGLLVGLGAVQAQAGSFALLPPTQEVMVGDTVTLGVTMDFSTDPTVGGGLDIFYDPAVLSYQDFVFATELNFDFGFTGAPVLVSPGVLQNLYIGNFSGLAGPALVGTLTFSADAMGTSLLTMADSALAAADGGAGPFYSAATFAEQVVDYTGAEVNVNVVPIPGSVLLLGSGLVGLVGVRRRRSG